MYTLCTSMNGQSKGAWLVLIVRTYSRMSQFFVMHLGWYMCMYAQGIDFDMSDDIFTLKIKCLNFPPHLSYE